MPRDNADVMLLQHPHIIIEDTTRRYRSFYKEFAPDSGQSTLPSIDWSAPPGTSPFEDAQVSRSRLQMREQTRYAISRQPL